MIPEPEAQAADPAARLNVMVTYAMMTRFEQLVQAAVHRGFIREDVVGRAIEGTAYWLLSARIPATPANICPGEEDSVLVYGAFHEFTPTDAYLSAIVQNRFPGVIEDVLPLIYWSFDPIVGVSSLRNQFNTDA